MDIEKAVRAEIRRVSTLLFGKADYRLEIAVVVAGLPPSFTNADVIAAAGFTTARESTAVSRNLDVLYEAGFLGHPGRGQWVREESVFWRFVADLDGEIRAGFNVKPLRASESKAQG